MVLTRHEAEENMKHMQLLCKERHDKPWKKTHCHQCDHGTIKTPRKEAKKHDTLKEKTRQAMDEIKISLENDDFELPTTHKALFYPGQKILVAPTP